MLKLVEEPTPLQRLLDIMARLRNPVGGCPWDLEQTYHSITPHTLEEAYEVVAAVQSGDMANLKEELGDLLLQVLFYSQFAKEDGHFTFTDVMHELANKLVSRHPHVFGEATAATSAEALANWNSQKDKEKQKTTAASTSVLDGVPHGLPALMRARKLHKRATKAGFDWTDIQEIIGKMDEEYNELKEAIAEGDTAHIREEFGDTFFTMVRVADALGIDADDALRGCNSKFERRFRHMESYVATHGEGKSLRDAGPDLRDKGWQDAKAIEKANKSA
jgi:MazG family protein